jgi:hypothetical protein
MTRTAMPFAAALVHNVQLGNHLPLMVAEEREGSG